MDASQVSVRERLAQIGLSDEEEKAIIVKLVEGTVSPSNWNIVNNLELAASIRVLIQPAPVGAPPGISRWDTFVNNLASANIKPLREVLDKIAERYGASVDSVASSVDRSITFYRLIKDLPNTADSF